MIRGMKPLVLITAFTAVGLLAQAPPGPAGAGPSQRSRRSGGFVPGQERPTGDPELIARGKQSYEINCRGCHGADLRGGDMGGPNLLRSQIALGDHDGERIVPVIQGSLAGSGMPAINMPPDAAKATAAYVRSVLATIGVQGVPPSSTEPPSIIVGNASEGQAFFASKCANCHSSTGDLKGIASRMADPKILQNTWVAGRARMGRGSRGGGGGADTKPVTVTVRQPSGETVDGKLIRIDDFLVTLELPDGTSRTFRRDGNVPKVEVHDPLDAHREIMSVLSDKDLHDVTAYLVTLK
jgi:cytochrome c oxidase cbb3-type subunit 3